MGNCIQALSESVTLIASDDTWIEGNAIQQLHTTARLAGMRRVAGMPDLHPGRGYPVGAAFFSTGRLYPALIGGDIGCGMSLWSTGIDARKAATAKLEKRLGDIDGPLDDSWQPLVDELAPADVGHRQALGTIGGGNHFAELQRIDTSATRRRSTRWGWIWTGSSCWSTAGRVAWAAPSWKSMSSGTATTALPKTAPIARPTWPGTTPPCATPRPTGSWSLAACWTGSARKADSC